MKSFLCLLFLSAIILAQNASKHSLYKAEMDCTLLDQPKPSESRIKIKKGDLLEYMGFADDEYYCKVKFNNTPGYVMTFVLKEQLRGILDSIKLIQTKKEQETANEIKRIAALEKAMEDSILDLRAQQREKKIIKTYGKVTGTKILNGNIWLGMTDKMARESWGEPNDINRSVGSWGVHEQWVCGDTYLYFENGKLKSWQD